jgi:hypothetical protein
MTDKKDTTFVFRLQNGNEINEHGLQNTLKHWDESCMFDDKQINAIESSNNNSPNQPTSIPSPFAQIALVKTAFSEVAIHGEDALASFQKIVSDSLDVAEIFFTFDKWKDEIEIIKWDKQTDLQELSKHKILHKTLETFLKDDAETFNFSKMQSIYILKHVNAGIMIGATSPCTLFFSSANNLVDKDGEFYNEDIKSENKAKTTFGKISLSNNHSAFSEIFQLHKRSWDFQKYLYTWLKLNNETRQIDDKPVSIFSEFEKYLNAQRSIPDLNNPNKLNLLDPKNLPNDFGIYDELRAPDVNVLGKSLHKNKANNKTAISYLTTKDFLENKIIRLPYRIQNESFFDGNLNETSKYSYLLPIKDSFFKYYTIAELQKFIRINEVGTIVEVKLEIPSLKQEIKKIYKESDSMVLFENGIDCMIFPNVKFTKQDDAFYRIGLFLPYTQKNKTENYSVDFYSENNKIVSEKPIIRNTNDAENPICKIYSLNQKIFDRIKISYENAGGILVPKLPEKGDAEDFTFAVDFGTTNTHIEYKTTTDNSIRPFDIHEGNKQIHFLQGKNEGNTLVADIDFIPELINEKEMFKFPIRTALSLAKNKENALKVFPFEYANIIIPFEKRQVPKYNRILTQLKWDSTEDEMGYFIDSLCFMLRNKVVLNGGNLSNTKIVWFYPLSMAGSRSKIISEKWKLAYSRYFLGFSVNSVDDLEESVKENIKKNIIELPESVAPFLCYKDDSKYKDTINNLVSIDIGGGTTDIVFIKDGKNTEYVTSFRFAANSIFGLGEDITSVVYKYQSDIERIIEQNDPQFKLRNILKSITGSASGDIASFFFSLSDNEMLKNVDINFNSMLKRDNDQKLVFVLFYAAIIYHTAQIMKAKNLKLPRHITFSGNGSRIVNIVADKEILAELSKCIFENVFREKYGNSGLDIIQNTKNPKEVTCKGGIKAAEKDYIQTSFKPVVLWGIDDATFITDNNTYSSINIEDNVTRTNKQVKTFVDFVLDDLLNQKYTKGVVAETFIKTLNLNKRTLQIAKDICAKEEDFATFTRNGITRKIESINDTSSTQIEETFFFYPITSLLNTISNEINKIN